MARAGSGSAGTSYQAGMRRTSPAAQRRTRRRPSQVFVFLRLGYCYLPRSKSFLPRLPQASLLLNQDAHSRRLAFLGCSYAARQTLIPGARSPGRADRRAPRGRGTNPRSGRRSRYLRVDGRRSRPGGRAPSHPSPALVNAWHTSMMSTTPRRPASPATGR